MLCHAKSKIFALALILPFLGGCSALSALSNFLPGGGDGVNANAQIGAENNQSVAQVATGDEIKAGDNSTIKKSDTANEVQGTQINHNDLPWWVWVLIGWMIPTPARIVCENFMDWRSCRRKD